MYKRQEYLKALRRADFSMEPITFPRRGGPHDGGAADGIASASHIRRLLRAGHTEEAMAFLPRESAEVLRREMAAGRGPVDMHTCQRAILARLRTMSQEDFLPYDGGGEGLYRRFYRTVRQAADIDGLLEAAKTATYDYSFINNNSEDPSRLEGYLFPDTYEFYKNHNAKNALGKLIDAFADHIDEDAFASSKAKSMGYSMKDVVIIASLIEKETDGTDQRDIASVIYNRLQKPGETAGLLQIDASLLYGLPDHTGAITNADKAVDTPYNLYLHKGLPPTAIANPGSAALKAAMDPNDTDYYYYALGTDGKHHFSKTLSEHNAFVGSSSYGG